MILKFYGTSGGQGLPALFCDCDTCRRARKAGGRNIMTRSQALLTADSKEAERLLIDIPGDTNHHVLSYGLDLQNIGHCIVTHVHGDHFCPEDIAIRGGFSIVTPEKVQRFHLYGSDVTRNRIARILDNDSRGRYAYTVFEPYQTYDAAGWTVTALSANHSEGIHALNYIIEREGKSVLYATDTAYPYEEFFGFMERRTETVFDLIVLDCTWTNSPQHIDHMNIDHCLGVAERLQKMGRTRENTRYILTHFAHFGLIYDEIVAVCADIYRETGIRFEVAYDGFAAEF